MTRDSQAKVLVVEDVQKRYGTIQALCGIDLEVGAGETVALLGHNGSGKTTLILSVAGLLRPDGGRVSVEQIDVAAHPAEAQRYIALAPQETGIYRTLSVRRNLQFFGELHGVRRSGLKERISEVANALALGGLLERHGHTLSGGEARRLHVGIALMSRPALLLLDEPTAGADAGTRDALIRTLRQLTSEGTAVCYSTHNASEVERLGAFVVVLENGRVIARGSPEELIGRYGRSYIDLRFHGSPPALDFGDGAEVIGSDGLRITTTSAADRAATRILRTLGPTDSRLSEMRVVRPNLESALQQLTDGAASPGAHDAHKTPKRPSPSQSSQFAADAQDESDDPNAT